MIQHLGIVRRPVYISALALSLMLVLAGQTTSLAQPSPEEPEASEAPAPTPEQPSISEEKQQLISELLEMTGGRQQYEQMQAFMHAQMQQQIVPMMTQMLQNSTDLSPEEEQAAVDTMTSRFNTLVEEFSAAMQAEITYDEMVEQVYYPVYDLYFTEEDLRGLVAFYETPLGEKLIAVSPDLMQSSIERSNAIFMPRMIEVLNELMQDMIEEQPVPGTEP